MQTPQEIAAEMEWDVEEARQFAADLLEDVNDHDGARLLRAFAEQG